MKHARSRFLALFAAGTLALLHTSPPAHGGVQFSWDGGGGDGVFQTDENWTGDTAPGADDNAVFDNITDTITFTANASTNNLDILNGSDVVFDLGGFTYSIVNQLLIDNSALGIANGTVSAATVIINAGGSMAVDADATLNVTGDETLIVGDDSAGTLDIAGDVNAESLVVGNQAGGDGTVLVTDGGQLGTGSAVVGADAGATGEVNINGNDGGNPAVVSAWVNSGTITIGDAGTGTVNVGHDGNASTGDGGALITDSLILGNEATGDGTLNVGQLASVSVTGNATLVVGQAGTGAVNVESGGLLESVNTVIAADAGSSGTVIIDGDDGEAEPTVSTWTNSGSIIVADGGTGELNIGHDGNASTGNGGAVATDALIVGNQAGSDGTVNVGAGATLNSNSAVIAGVADAVGAANIAGTWINSGDLVVGVVPDDDGGVAGAPLTDGQVNVSGDGVLVTHTVTVGQGGAVTQADDSAIVVSNDADLDPDDVDFPGAGMHVGAGDGAGVLNILEGGTVTADDDVNVGAEGTGTINLDGAGSTLTAANLNIGFDDADLDGVAAAAADLTGRVFVNNDAEVVGDVTVGETGLLGGDGLITGNVSVFGWLAPGASIGTMDIDGDLDLEAGSVLEVEYNDTPVDINAEFGIDPANLPAGFEEVFESDLVVVTGTATLADGSTIQIVKLTGGNQIGDAIIVICANDVVDGGVVVEGNEFVVWTAQEIAGDADYLLLTAEFDQDAFDDFLGSVGGNLKEVADALAAGELFDIIGAIGDADEDLVSLLPLQNGAALVQNLQTSRVFNNSFLQEMAAHRSGLGGIALNASGGPLLASAAHNPTELARAIDALDRSSDPLGMAALQDEGAWGGFLRGMGLWDDVDSDGADRIGHQARIFGIHGGVHTNLSPDFLLGISLGYLNTDIDFKDNFGDGDVHTVRVGPYLSWSPGGGDFFIDASVTYGYHRNDVSRNTLMGTASADYNAHDISAFAQAGIDFLIFDRTVLTPMAGVEFTWLRTDSYSESGAGLANLDVDSESVESLRLRLGAKISHAIDLAGLTLVPEFYAGWAQEVLDDDHTLSASFVGTPGTAFSTNVDGVGSSALQIAAGISALFDPNMALFIRYEGEFQSDRDAHGVVGGVNFNF